MSEIISDMKLNIPGCDYFSEEFYKCISFCENNIDRTRRPLRVLVLRTCNICDFCKSDFLQLSEKDVYFWLKFKSSTIKFVTAKSYFIELRYFSKFIEDNQEKIKLSKPYKSPFSMDTFNSTCPKPYNNPDFSKGSNILSKKFGDLTVMGKSSNPDMNGNYLFECKCSCGATIYTKKSDLLTGLRTHCGDRTKHSMDNFDSLINKTFGNWNVLSLSPERKNDHLAYLCKCKLCGREKVVRSSSLIDGSSTGCGCNIKRGRRKKED